MPALIESSGDGCGDLGAAPWTNSGDRWCVAHYVNRWVVDGVSDRSCLYIAMAADFSASWWDGLGSRCLGEEDALCLL